VSRAVGAGLILLALGGAAGTFVFGLLLGQGGREYMRNIILGVMCAMVPPTMGAIAGFRSSHRIRAEIEARDRAIADRAQALESKQEAEREAVDAEAQLIFALRARLSPILYCLGTMAAPPPDAQVGELLGRLTQAVLAAAVVHRDSTSARRSIFFKTSGDRMECAGYAGPEGRKEAQRTVYTRGSDDQIGAYMFRILEEDGAVLVPDLGAPKLQVRFPKDRSYQTAIAAAVTAGNVRYGVLTLDAPEAGTLGKTDLEIVKTLASLLGVGLAQASTGTRRKAGTSRSG
jgi:hypothetical protein